MLLQEKVVGNVCIFAHTDISYKHLYLNVINIFWVYINIKYINICSIQFNFFTYKVLYDYVYIYNLIVYLIISLHI